MALVHFHSSLLCCCVVLVLNFLTYIYSGTTFEHSALFADHAGPTGGHYAIWQMMNNAEKRGISDFVTAATVRHPCDRFISAFRYLTSDKCNEGDRINSEQQIGNRTIDEYVHHLEETGFDGTQKHFKPQYEFVVSKDGQSVDVNNILCREDWDEGTDRLAAAIGHNNGFPKLHTSHLLTNAHEACSDLEAETVAAIERLFWMDYCLFGYPLTADHQRNLLSNADFGNESWECPSKHLDKESLTGKYTMCKINHGNL